MKNKKEKIEISEIFSSLQGEGKYAGTPMLFIRTYGCTKRCPWCDTRYAIEGSKYKEMTVNQLVKIIKNYEGLYICWTGGEPLLWRKGIEKIIEKIKGITNDYKKGYLLGVRYGDGYINYKKRGFTLQCKDFEMLLRFKKYIRDLFGKEYSTQVVTKDSNQYTGISICANEIVNFLDTKPQSKEQERGFVSGFFDSEGTICCRGNSVDLSIAQKEPEILKYIIRITKRYGLDFTLYDFREKHNMCGLRLKIKRRGWYYDKKEVQDFYRIFQPAIRRKFKKVKNLKEIKFHLESNGDLLNEYDFLMYDYLAISPKEQKVIGKINKLIEKYNFITNWDIKVVTDLDKIGKDLIPYATMLMPLSTYNKKKDLQIQRKVWNYCIKYNFNFTPRYQYWIWGKKRSV